MIQTNVNYNQSKYKGFWRPNTHYKQYDVVHYGGALRVSDSDFTSGVTFNESNWTCATCP